MGQQARRRGALILFEGLDRCGKTTQCKQLVETLRQKQVPVKHLSFPDRTRDSGVLIDKFLRKEIKLDPIAVHLLFSSNRQERRTEMLQDLEAGTTLVVDRYAYSGAAFTSAQLPAEDPAGRDLRWCQESDRGLPAPDVIIGLELTPDAAAARGSYGGEAYENVEFQRKEVNYHMGMSAPRWPFAEHVPKRAAAGFLAELTAQVREQFTKLAEASPQWTRVDASGSIEQVASRVNKIAQEAIDACQQGAPITLLWNSVKPLIDVDSLSMPAVGSEAQNLSSTKKARHQQGAAHRSVLAESN